MAAAMERASGLSLSQNSYHLLLYLLQVSDDSAERTCLPCISLTSSTIDKFVCGGVDIEADNSR
jgi:hypothetical protein